MKCECGRYVGDLSEYRRCCAAASAVRAFRMFGSQAGRGYIERVREWQGDAESDAVRAEARRLAELAKEAA